VAREQPLHTKQKGFEKSMKIRKHFGRGKKKLVNEIKLNWAKNQNISVYLRNTVSLF
jgi:hypothetical protein